MSAKITGISMGMDDILHSMWSGNQGFREGVKVHDSTHPKELKRRAFSFINFFCQQKLI